MPELPEVETVRSQLNEVLEEVRVEKVEVKREKSFKGRKKDLLGKEVKKVERKAKILAVFLEGKKVLLVHLKMTGQLVWLGKRRIAGGHPTADWVGDLPSKHTRVIIDFGEKGRLYFNDMRGFGWMKLVKEGEWLKMKEEMPVDVIDEDFKWDYLREILMVSRRAVKLVIMDHKKLGGVGNIYANEGLFLAKIDPRRKARSLSEKEVKKLYGCLVKVVKEGIRWGGTTASDEKFVDTYGLGGKYQKKLKVYDREGEKCLICGGKIKRVKFGGRSAYFCPKCQK